ncbi:MAG: hypothetical protein EXR77_13170 [Myxococcales bacterium]|nr:hypothetical protein [Myxococcales bacterium]
MSSAIAAPPRHCRLRLIPLSLCATVLTAFVAKAADFAPVKSLHAVDAVRLCGPDDHSRTRPPHAANEVEVLNYVLPQVLQAHGIWEQRLWVKHAMGWYDRRPRDLDHAFAVGPNDIEAYLQAVIPQEQPAALLIYWWGRHRTGQPRLLCTGLIRTGRRLLLQATEIPACGVSTTTPPWR